MRFQLLILVRPRRCGYAHRSGCTRGYPVDAPAPQTYTVDAGVKLPLSLINSISTKHSQAGDRVYLESAFPILSRGRIVIPVGSYVAGTVTEIKKPGRVKGRGELYVRFDTLTLPNGVTRDFTSRMGTMDASSSGKLDRDEGKVVSEGQQSRRLQTVAETTATGASVGGIAGAVGSHAGMGLESARESAPPPESSRSWSRAVPTPSSPKAARSR